MKSLSKDVEEFYRLRIIVTFESGRTYTDILGPYTRMSKAREIKTRMGRVWNSTLSRRHRHNLPRDPDTLVSSIRYIIEMAPSFGWYPKSDDTYTAD